MKSFPRIALVLFLSVWPFSYAAAQQLQCSPCSKDYGQVQVGSAKQYTFQLTNTGSKSLTISAKRKNGKDFSFSKFSLPVTLQPGKGTQMSVNFHPSVAGKETGTITLISNALNPNLTLMSRVQAWLRMGPTSVFRHPI